MNIVKFTGTVSALFLLVIILGCSNYLVAAEKQNLAIGSQLPEITLATPEEPSLRHYLGLEKQEKFSLGEIKSEILIIEIFSMYCPHCQKDAPAINELYELIEEDKKLAKRVKLIGIGAGNSTFEVGVFKDKYKVPFPLFADDDLSIHRKIGSVRTPYFIGICNQGKGKNRIFFSQLAGFSGAQKFLKNILEAADCH